MKKILIALLLMVFPSLISSSALAADTYVWLLTDHETKYYFDQKSISYDKGTGIIDVWIKMTFEGKMLAELKKSNKNYSYIVTHYQLNEKTKKIKGLQTKIFDVKDKQLKEYTLKEEWQELDRVSAEGLSKLLPYVKQTPVQQ